MSRRTRSHLAVLLVFLSLCLCRGALAQDFAAAGRHFATAQDAFAQGRYAQAAQEYQSAYDITQDPVLLFNIGESWQRAGETAKAIKGYRDYLRAQPAASDKAEVNKRLQALEAASAEGGGEKGAAAAPGQAAQPALLPKPAPLDKPRPTGSPGPMSGYRTGAWVAVAVGVGILTGAAILGLAAQSRADEINLRATQVAPGQAPPVYDANQQSAYQALLSDGQNYNTAAIVCYSLAGAAALTSAVLFLIDYKVKRAEKRPALTFLPVTPVLQRSGQGTGSMTGLVGAWSF